MTELPVFSQRLAGFLMHRGYRLIRVEPNRRLPKFHVFIFEDSEGLREKMAEYKRTE
jgi:hypothetical protein